MDVHIIKRRTFKKTFLSYTVILIIPIFIFLYISLQNVMNNNYKKLIEMHESDTERVAATIDSKLMECMHIGDKLYHSNWISKFMIDIDVFDDEFGSLRRQEICQDLNNYTAFTGILSNIAVVFPYKDLVVSQRGWYQKDAYFSDIIKIKEHDIEKIYSNMDDYAYFRLMEDTKVTAVNDEDKYIVICQSLELYNKPRAVLLFFIDERYLTSYIKKITSPNLQNIVITSNDMEIFNQDVHNNKEKTGNELIFTTKSSVMSWEYKCIYNDYNLPIQSDQLFPLYIGIAFSLILGAFMALILATISYKPLYSLLNRIFRYDEAQGMLETTSDKNMHEYRIIENSFDRLVDENEAIINRMKNYESAAKSNMLLKLLKGFFNDDKLEDKLNEIGLNYTDDDYFCVALINISQTAQNDGENVIKKRQEIINLILTIEQNTDQMGIDCQILDVLDDAIGLIFAFDYIQSNSEVIDQLLFKAKSSMEKSGNVQLVISMGNMEQGIIGISKSYQMARENMEYMLFESDFVKDNKNMLEKELYYYPTDWEIQLINNLKVGNLDTVTKIIYEIRLENEKRDLPLDSMIRLVTLIMETELRVLDELNIDVGLYQNEFNGILASENMDEIWSYIYEISDRVCDRRQYANTTSNLEIGNNILEYINKNYNDPNLALKELAQIFNMSVSSLSKLFKEVTGINYYDYLCRIRMEQAKELLKDSKNAIGKVASEVGYENEYSFKRAFKRYEGISPSDYIYKIAEGDSK